MPPTYKDGVTQERSRIQEGIDQLEATYEELHNFVRGESEAPLWVTWLAAFRAAIDQVKRGAVELDGGP